MGAALRRVAVLGCSGAGKSTLAVELARRTDLPLVHLDEHFWQPGWVMPPDKTWREVQRVLVAEPAWVLDGNYATTFDERLPYADTVVVLETGRWRCLARVLRRCWRDRGRLVAPGCPMALDAGHLRYIWRFPRNGMPRLESAIAALPTGVRVERLRSRRDVDRFLASVRPG